jgi:hypothetical protein
MLKVLTVAVESCQAALVARQSHSSLAALARPLSHREIARIMQPLIDPLGIA